MMQRSIARTSFLALAMALVLGACLVALAGCSSTFTIGTNSQEAVKIDVKNETGQAITAVAVKSSFEQDFSDALEQEGDWQSDASAELYIDPAIVEVSSEKTVEGENATVVEQSDVVLEPRTDIQITTADGMTYALHQLNIEDVKDATLKIEDGTAYLVYTSIATGEEVNTLDAERAYQDQQKAAAEAEQAAADQERDDQSAAKSNDSSANGSSKSSTTNTSKSSSTSNSSSSSNSSSNSSSSASSGGDSSSASSGEDACVDDLVLN